MDGCKVGAQTDVSVNGQGTDWRRGSRVEHNTVKEGKRGEDFSLKTSGEDLVEQGRWCLTRTCT